MKLCFWRRDPADRLADYSDLSKLAAPAREVERAFAEIPEAMSVFEIPSGIRIEKPRFHPPGQKPKPKPPPLEWSRG